MFGRCSDEIVETIEPLRKDGLIHPRLRARFIIEPHPTPSFPRNLFGRAERPTNKGGSRRFQSALAHT